MTSEAATSNAQPTAPDRTPRTLRRRRFAMIATCAFAFVSAALLAGFFAFASHVTGPLSRPLNTQPVADGIVALTGSSARIAEAGRLLGRARANRLLISGVNRRTTGEDLRRLTTLSKPRFSCCVDIGYEAQNTRGNGIEAAAWIAQNSFRRVLVVTSAFHMPRSLTELARWSPRTTWVPYPVAPRRRPPGPWWLNAGQLQLLLGEYVKFLPSAARYVVARGVDRIWPQKPVARQRPAPPPPVPRSGITSS